MFIISRKVNTNVEGRGKIKELITLIPDAPESWVHESIIKLRKIRDIMQG